MATYVSVQTFATDVAPLLQKNCHECRRPGQAAPFSMLTYEQVRPWAKAIKAAVTRKKMPPWFADPQYGHFSNAEGTAVNPAANRVYVANPGDGTVTLIDGATDNVVASAKAGSYPQARTVNPATNKIYVANNYAHSVTVIDGATHTATTVRVGQGPRGMAANPATNKIYTANYGSRDATEIDGATNEATSLPMGEHPWAISLDGRSNHVYVANEDTVYGGGQGTTHYSPLDQINRNNVSELRPAWVHHAPQEAARYRGSVECTPLIVDGVMYIVGAALIVEALDAATGRLLWTHAPASSGPQRRGRRHQPRRDVLEGWRS